MKNPIDETKLSRFLDKYLINEIDLLVKFLRTDSGIALFAILSLLVMMAHTAWVFDRISQGSGTFWSKTVAVVFSFVVDGAILIFTLRGRKDIANGATTFQVVMNVFYYYETIDVWYEWIPAVFISLSLPVAINIFSDEVAKALEKAKLEEIPNKVVQAIREDIENVKLVLALSIKGSKEISVQIDDRIDGIANKVDKLQEANTSQELAELGNHVNALKEQTEKALVKAEASFDVLSKLRNITPSKGRMGIYDSMEPILDKEYAAQNEETIGS